MRRTGLILPALAIMGLALAGCVSPAEQTRDKENLLAAAGFTQVPVNTPERQASLSSMPPHKFVRQLHDGKVVYTYADPTICNCLYVGGEKAYDAYRKEVFDKQIADERNMTAQMNQDAMQWGFWGPGPGMGMGGW